MENNNEFLKKMGRRIKAARALHGIAQEKLSEMSGLHRGSLSRIEQGKKNVHILTLKAFADTLGMDVKDFL